MINSLLKEGSLKIISTSINSIQIQLFTNNNIVNTNMTKKNSQKGS